ncbi:uncharacterized protein [Ptychodera flava]|uniref:uncharacterized protein n=1 Tax=Ptychodera flava TaxID=63121 RepID=UPI00396A372F
MQEFREELHLMKDRRTDTNEQVIDTERNESSRASAAPDEVNTTQQHQKGSAGIQPDSGVASDSLEEELEYARSASRESELPTENGEGNLKLPEQESGNRGGILTTPEQESTSPCRGEQLEAATGLTITDMVEESTLMIELNGRISHNDTRVRLLGEKFGIKYSERQRILKVNQNKCDAFHDMCDILKSENPSFSVIRMRDIFNELHLKDADNVLKEWVEKKNEQQP